jgi:hypothetical protein
MTSMLEYIFWPCTYCRSRAIDSAAGDRFLRDVFVFDSVRVEF